MSASTLKARDLSEGLYIIDSADYHWVVRRLPNGRSVAVRDGEAHVAVSQIYLNDEDGISERPEVYQIPFDVEMPVLVYDEDTMLDSLRSRRTKP